MTTQTSTVVAFPKTQSVVLGLQFGTPEFYAVWHALAEKVENFEDSQAFQDGEYHEHDHVLIEHMAAKKLVEQFERVVASV